MTHKDIYTKFMIEYDKANVTSSYPSLTEYEVATVLDKAYHALISQKLTGNNVRHSTFEADVKAIEDLRPLLVQSSVNFELSDGIVTNLAKGTIPEQSLYLMKVILQYSIPGSKKLETFSSKLASSTQYASQLTGVDYIYELKKYIEIGDSPSNYTLKYTGKHQSFKYRKIHSGIDGMELDDERTGTLDDIKRAMILLVDEEKYFGIYVYATDPDDQFVLYEGTEFSDGPMDQKNPRALPAKQVSHDMAEKFYSSAYNLPWIKQPVFYIEDNYIYVVFDPIKTPALSNTTVIYIKIPNKFVKDDVTPKAGEESRTYFQVKGANSIDITNTVTEYQFECNDTVAEELISLAIAFALENIESPRLNSKLTTRRLEA